MILGIGTDIIEVGRIKSSIDKWGNDFLKHVFTEEEIAYAEKKKYPTQHYAARFAAKEAVYKAIGDNPKIGWKDITILNDEFGRPCCTFKDKTFKYKVLISLSHTENYAVASAVITSESQIS